MATVYELLASREGGTRGNDGTQGHGRSFHVTVDSVNDDPSAVIQVTPTADTGEIVSIGAPHPWGAFGVVVTNFREAERLFAKGKLDWIIDAIYGVPLIPDPLRPWDISVDVSLDTYTAYLDLDNQPIGPGVYHPIPTIRQYPGDAFQAEKDRLAELGFDIGSKFRTPTSGGYIDLYAMTNNKRRAVGLQRTRKVAQFTLTKVLPRLAPSQIAAVQAMVNTVNLNTFFGARPESAKFVGMRSRSGPGIMTGQTVPNIIFDVELLFSIDWDGHNPKNLDFDLYEHKDGTQGVVENTNGQPVKRAYRLYDKLEFGSILAWLDR